MVVQRLRVDCNLSIPHRFYQVVSATHCYQVKNVSPNGVQCIKPYAQLVKRPESTSLVARNGIMNWCVSPNVFVAGVPAGFNQKVKYLMQLRSTVDRIISRILKNLVGYMRAPRKKELMHVVAVECHGDAEGGTMMSFPTVDPASRIK